MERRGEWKYNAFIQTNGPWCLGEENELEPLNLDGFEKWDEEFQRDLGFGKEMIGLIFKCFDWTVDELSGWRFPRIVSKYGWNWRERLGWWCGCGDPCCSESHGKGWGWRQKKRTKRPKRELELEKPQLKRTQCRRRETHVSHFRGGVTAPFPEGKT